MPTKKKPIPKPITLNEEQQAVVSEKLCSRCKTTKSLEEFNKDKSKPLGRGSWCRACLKEYREEHFEHFQEISKIWRKENSEELKKKDKERRERDKERERRERAENGDEIVRRALENREKITEKKCSRCSSVKTVENFSFKRDSPDGCAYWCKECQSLYLKEVRHKYLPHKNASARETRAKLRLEVLRHYSGEVPSCACCGEIRVEFLAIDHIQGGGSEHKRQVKHVYKWLKDNDFPNGFRVLCHNCNQSRGAYGYCPHEKEREATTQESERGTIPSYPF